MVLLYSICNIIFCLLSRTLVCFFIARYLKIASHKSSKHRRRKEIMPDTQKNASPLIFTSFNYVATTACLELAHIFLRIMCHLFYHTPFQRRDIRIFLHGRSVDIKIQLDMFQYFRRCFTLIDSSSFFLRKSRTISKSVSETHDMENTTCIMNKKNLNR